MSSKVQNGNVRFGVLKAWIVCQYIIRGLPSLFLSSCRHGWCTRWAYAVTGCFAMLYWDPSWANSWSYTFLHYRRSFKQRVSAF